MHLFLRRCFRFMNNTANCCQNHWVTSPNNFTANGRLKYIYRSSFSGRNGLAILASATSQRHFAKKYLFFCLPPTLLKMYPDFWGEKIPKGYSAISGWLNTENFVCETTPQNGIFRIYQKSVFFKFLNSIVYYQKIIHESLTNFPRYLQDENFQKLSI